jgi:uncharacterized repeat protein (TIGR03843 family)
MSTNELPAPEVLSVLKLGKVSIEGEFLWGSNYTFLAQVTQGNITLRSVYKPTRGERPLWDFPVSSLARREVAAYLVSEALGWELVPPTVYRKKGPVGQGSLQLFIEHDPEYHYFNFRPEDLQRLRSVALFDILINNADRKGSHVLIDPHNHIWLIDHGVCFHEEEKLRTVIWDFSGEPLPEELCASLNLFYQKLLPKGGLPSELTLQLQDYLSANEVSALTSRAKAVLVANRFPPPNPYRRPYPWPQI